MSELIENQPLEIEENRSKIHINLTSNNEIRLKKFGLNANKRGKIKEED
jgi:hypothetical protein